MEITEFNVFCGEVQPQSEIVTACTKTVNEGIYSVEQTWSDGSVHTYWYVVKQTKFIDEVKLAELEHTSLEHDELIAELIEGGNE